jgi:hypothetical protein
MILMVYLTFFSFSESITDVCLKYTINSGSKKIIPTLFFALS